MLSSEEATALLAGMDVSSVVGRRDRAIIAVMTYSFARVGAVVRLAVGDYYPQKRWWLRLREKNGKVNEMPCHHKLEAYLDAYIEAARNCRRSPGPLFRAAWARPKTHDRGADPQRRPAHGAAPCRRCEIETPIGCHTFRATGSHRLPDQRWTH